jgi:predicted ATPase/DNA-binding CsgD family transcriptional regulator
MVTMVGAGGRAARRVGRLVPELTSFVDRRAELGEVRQLIAGARLVTLTGAGGVGKTRLAGRVAGQLRRAFADGVWQVELADIPDAAMLELALVEAWGISSVGDAPPSRLLTEYVAERELLLLLDNCEHLLDACATLAGALLRAGPGLRMLCTSRQPLGMVGETVWQVPPLPVPKPDVLPVAVDDPAHAAVALFVARAVAASGFTLTPDNQRTVVEICDRLDGLPLAIELAAAKLRTLSLEQLAVGLADRFRLLSARHGVPEHHRTLRETFDWSFALCSPGEQALWARLAVFSGRFDLDAVTAVCADDDEVPAESMLGLIAGLIDKSVVLRDRPVRPVRYRLLDSVRAYGLDRLRTADDLRVQIRRRHADWYVRCAGRFDAAWFGSRQPELCATLQADLGNYRTAFDFCLTTPGQAQSGLRLAAALRYYWIACGGLSEGRYWLARSLAADDTVTPARVAAQSAYSRILITQGDHVNAAVSVAACLELAGQLDDPLLVTRATQDLGMHLLMAGQQLTRAQQLLEAALTGYDRVDHSDDASVAIARMSLALTVLYQGDPQRAAQLFADCRAVYQDRWDDWCRAHMLVGSGLVAIANGDSAGATGYLLEALPYRMKLGDTVGVAQATELLGRAVAACGDYERSARLTGAAHRIWRELGRTGFGISLYQKWVKEADERVRAELGERTYRAAYDEGWGFSVEDTIAYALGSHPQPDRPLTAPPPATPLTPREKQVAHLIAEGLSNKQVAARLVISERTAESHAANILRKLGFTSRAQVAYWIARHGQDPPSAPIGPPRDLNTAQTNES